MYTCIRVVVERLLQLQPKQLIFLRKSDCLGCAVLLCLAVCLTLFASFFLLSHLSLKHTHVPFSLPNLSLLCFYVSEQVFGLPPVVGILCRHLPALHYFAHQVMQPRGGWGREGGRKEIEGRRKGREEARMDRRIEVWTRGRKEVGKREQRIQ